MQVDAFSHAEAANQVTPGDKRGIAFRAKGTSLLCAGAILVVAGVILTAFLQVYVSVPLFLIAGALFFFGRRALNDSAKKIVPR
jgi:Flp pilus assembly protein TadB